MFSFSSTPKQKMFIEETKWFKPETEPTEEEPEEVSIATNIRGMVLRNTNAKRANASVAKQKAKGRKILN